MSTPHSSVIYIEPNSLDEISSYDWSVTSDNKIYDRVIDPEDYCIGLTITTELCSRGEAYSTNDRYIRVQWDNNGSKSKVNFMSGTLVKEDPTNDKSASFPYLTTNYADMYVTDLHDYGTTEMIGIKSVNIDFENAVIPVITVEFTDVRGMSLFTPRELDGLDLLSKSTDVNCEDVAKAFFQCFFRFPYPKFNITVKGFYGKAVSYEVTCDKFETNFNSETGSFDVTVRFIGYKYSFLSDISLDLLYTAPYCDFIGKEYWNEKVNSNEFQITDINGNKVEMPRLVDIRNKIKEILAGDSDIITETTLTREENSHDEERRQLEQIKSLYYAWYQEMAQVSIKRFGNDKCFVDIDAKSDEYRRILILTDGNSEKKTLADENVQFPTKKTNDLLALIKNYNERFGNGGKLEEFKGDFSSFAKIDLFKDVIKQNDNTFIFKGFVEDCPIREIAKRMVIMRISDNISDEQSLGTEARMQKTLKTIYNDGVTQNTSCYYINLDYSIVQKRINKLTEDSNNSYMKKRKAKELHEMNISLINKLGFNPTISNFTKIVMAHLETLMHMIYKVTDEIKANEKRTPAAIGASTGRDGTFSDVKNTNDDSVKIPPFPRVTKTIRDDDGSERQQDIWIGDLDNDALTEADLVETFFNGIAEVNRIINETDDKIKEDIKQRELEENGGVRAVMKYPLTSFDFFLNSNIYGEDVTDSIEKLAGAVSIRMFGILSLNFFAKQFNSKWCKNNDFASLLGKTEAHNFYYSVDTRKNENLKNWIKLDNGTFNADNVLKIVKSVTEKYPWSLNKGDRNLQPLISKDNLLDRYYLGDTSNRDKSKMFPVQNISFDSINESFDLFKSNENFSNKDVVISIPKTNVNGNVVGSLDSYNAHYSLIIEDDYDRIKNIMNSSMAESTSAYTEISNLISSACTLESAVERYYSGYIKTEGRTSFVKKRNIKKKGNDILVKGVPNHNKLKTEFSLDDGAIKIEVDNGYFAKDTKGSNVITYNITQEDLEDYYTKEIFNKNINNYFISDIFAKFQNDKGYNGYVLSLVGSNTYSPIEFLMGVDCLNYDKINSLNNNTFNFVPKLLVLQFGAVLNEASDLTIKIEDKEIDRIQESTRIVFSDSFKKLAKSYLNKIGVYSRLVILKYFIDWKEKNFNKILSGLKDSKNIVAIATTSYAYNSYSLLYEGSSFVKELTNMLMLPTLLVNGNVFHNVADDSYHSFKINRTKVSDGIFKSYLTSFIDELNQLMGVDYEKDENGNMIRRTSEASHTSDDMRMELYRYLKQIYDKWIPSSNEATWNYKNFFDDEESSIKDYQFHFIDSYYNKIGNKLLINPGQLVKRLDAAMSYSDINSSVYSLLGWVYQDSRCLFKCIQNFQDLSDERAMKEMFKPLTYSDAIKNLRNGSSFVVVYTYEPSKYLNMNSSEYEDDGFMLNQEEYTPMSIKTRGGDESTFYKIPAFGVTYGKQYQSYFKNVSVDTKSSIQTQQAIFAKHQILNSKTDKNKLSTKAQDLFDLYTTQSYTCKVDMMGCAWVQPMMYFVLLNIPMFRGSYMIMKVNHRITPGNMSTTFTGCRMANASNKFVEDIFLPNEGEELEAIGDESVSYDEAHADVDNDCPYKVYPIFRGEGALNGNELQKGKQLMDKLIAYGYTKIAAAGIVGNMRQEVGGTFNETSVCVDSDKLIAGGLCGWNDRYGNLTHLLEKNSTNFGKTEKDGKIRRIASGLKLNGVKEKLGEIGVDYQIQFIDETIGQVTISSDNKKPYSKEILNGCSSPENAAESFRAAYERGTESNNRQKFARQFYDNYDTTSYEVNNDNNKDKQVYEEFFNSIQMTANNTESMMFTLKKDYYPNKDADNVRVKKFLMISASDSANNSKLSKVFDCILNTYEYFKYVRELYWVYSSEGDDITKIIRVDVVLSSKEVPTNNQHVWFYKSGTRQGNERFFHDRISFEILSDDAKKSLKKCYSKIGKDNFLKLFTQLRDDSGLNSITIADCASVGNGGSSSGSLEGYNGNVKDGSKLAILLDKANNGKALNYLNSKKLGENYKLLDAKIYGKKAYKQCCTSGPTTWYKRIGINLLWWNPKKESTSNHIETYKNFKAREFNLVWHGHLDDATKLPSSSFCPGDIATFHVYNSDGKATSHGVMWTGKDWRSDCIQKALSCYPGGKDRDGAYSVCVWRNPKLVSEGLGITNTPNLT